MEPAPSDTGSLHPSTLRLESLPACFSAEQLRRRIESELTGAGDIPVDIEIRGLDEATVEFTITTDTGTARRRFEFSAAACETKLRVLSLSIALALEALVTEKALSTSATADTPPPPATAAAPRVAVA
ncbi:MAG: hypothetical protein IAG13_12560, partial [Deltaproteobacteria bacterium]|nr:hypothetical protein [Nannocystaceae bacterium]